MKTILSLLLIILAATATLAQKSNDNTSAAKAEQEIRRLENERSAAILRADWATLDRIFGDDYTATTGFGQFKEKAQVLSDYKSGALKYEELADTEMRVRVYGDAAVITGLNTAKGKDRGREVSRQRRFTRVWILQDGRWRLVANQLTPVP